MSKQACGLLLNELIAMSGYPLRKLLCVFVVLKRRERVE